MKILSAVILLLFLSTNSFSQDPVTAELQALCDSQQYAKVIKDYASKPKSLSAKSLFYVGIAYYMTDDDKNSLKFMNLSIDKDETDPFPFFYRGCTLYYMEKYKDAIKSLETAIKLRPNDAEFYTRLGDAYVQLPDKAAAFKAYVDATELADCGGRAFFCLGQLYSDQHENEKALDAFYAAKSKTDRRAQTYNTILFNIGLLELLKGNDVKAEPVFLQLLSLDSNDYHTYAKLIQICYSRKEYDKAAPYKAKLYEAYRNGLLTEHINDMFCFDQFKWNNYQVQAYERYRTGASANIYYKHIFYLMDSAGSVVFRVQTEYSPFAVSFGGPKYFLCGSKGNTHFNPGIGVSDDTEYPALKEAAIKMFEKYVK